MPLNISQNTDLPRRTRCILFAYASHLKNTNFNRLGFGVRLMQICQGWCVVSLGATTSVESYDGFYTSDQLARPYKSKEMNVNITYPSVFFYFCCVRFVELGSTIGFMILSLYLLMLCAFVAFICSYPDIIACTWNLRH